MRRADEKCAVGAEQRGGWVAGGGGIPAWVWGLVLGGGGGGHGSGVGDDGRDGEVGGAGGLWTVIQVAIWLTGGCLCLGLFGEYAVG